MKVKQIIDAYCHIRKIDNTIPDDVLDFMKDAAIEKIINSEAEQKEPDPQINYGVKSVDMGDGYVGYVMIGNIQRVDATGDLIADYLIPAKNISYKMKTK